MAGDPLKKVQTGERLEIHAEAYNAFIDAVRATRAQQALGADADKFARHTTLAKVRNLTGANLTRFSIVGLSQPIIPPTENEAEFLRQTTFDAVTPAAGYEHRFAILLEPLAPNKIGVAAVAGVVPVRVHFTANDHEYARITNGDATQLSSAASGEARILWHEEFPESTEPPDVTLWALVLLGTQRQPRIVAGTTNAAVLNTASAFQVENLTPIVGTAPTAPLTVQNWFGVGYAFGEAVVASELASGDWINEPYYGRVYATAGDTFPETLFYKLWGHGTFNPTDHQPVYFEVIAADLATHGPPVPRALVRAFTEKGTAGGGGDYDAGCGIDADELAAGTIQVLVDPYGCLECDPYAGLKVKVAAHGCLDCAGGPDGGLKVKVKPNRCLACSDEGLELKLPADTCFFCNENGFGIHLTSCLECTADGIGIKLDEPSCLTCSNDGLRVVTKPDGCIECTADGLQATYTSGPGIVIAGCTVSVNYGCGLTTTAGVLQVNNNDLAGSGLVPEGVCGLAVNVGCGLEIAADAVRVKLDDLTGCGLKVDTGPTSDPYPCPKLTVDTGCGLECTGDKVKVKVATGGCLECADPAGLKVKIDPDSCIECSSAGLKLKGDKVSVYSIKSCMLFVEEGQLKLKLQYDVVELCGTVTGSGERTCAVAGVICGEIT